MDGSGPTFRPVAKRRVQTAKLERALPMSTMVGWAGYTAKVLFSFIKIKQLFYLKFWVDFSFWKYIFWIE